MDAKETSLYLAILITGVVMTIIIFFFVISIISLQRKSLNLYKTYILAEMATLEKERARIASDLHDELGPMLAAVKMKINSFELSDPQDLVQLEKTNSHIDDILKRFREISYDLMPNTLLRKGVVMALKEFVNTINEQNHLKIELRAEPFSLSEQDSIHIYRIVQEIIHNTFKHANASELVIDFQKQKGNLILSSFDNGRGYNYEKVIHETAGLGLKNLLRRTEIMKGELFIESKKNAGTSYTFKIPMSS